MRWIVFPIPSMYGIFTYIWFIFMVNVGKYTLHGSYGFGTWSKYVNSKFDFDISSIDDRWSSHCWWFRNPAPGREKQWKTTLWIGQDTYLLIGPGFLQQFQCKRGRFNETFCQNASGSHSWQLMTGQLTHPLHLPPRRPYWGLISHWFPLRPAIQHLFPKGWSGERPWSIRHKWFDLWQAA